MLFSNLSKESNNFETTVTSDDGTVKGKSNTTDVETMKKFEKDNKTVRGHLLNHMTNPLFDLFVIFKFAKIIWEKLQVRYGADDVGKKKYVVCAWLHFQITDGKPIMEQVMFMRTCVQKF